MKGDIFGNLREWGHIPEQLAELAQAGALDDHQEGLIRLLRYRHNWRLREMALESVEHLKSPTDKLLLEVVRILTDDGLYCEVRMLAARVLGGWLQSIGVSDARSSGIARQIVEQLTAIVESPQSPVFHEAARSVLAAVQDTVALESV